MTDQEHKEGDITERIDRLSDPVQYRYLSAEELRTFLDPRPDWVVADLGSGTGFFTDEIAPVVEMVYAIDIQPAMHEAYRSRGHRTNVVPVTTEVAALPFADNTLHGAVSIRTFHHGVAGALDEVGRVLRPGGRLVVIDWSSMGAGERDHGTHPMEFFDLAAVQAQLLEVGFRIQVAHERRETFVVVGDLRY